MHLPGCLANCHPLQGQLGIYKFLVHVLFTTNKTELDIYYKKADK